MEPATAPTWYESLIVAPVQSLLTELATFLPKLLGAILILFVGWWIAKAIELVVTKVLKAIALDKLADQIQFSNVLVKGGIKRRLSDLLAAIIYWFVMLAVVMIAFNAVQLTVAADLFKNVVGFLPNVVAAVFILVVGIFAAAFLGTTVRTTASNAGILQAHLLGQAVQTTVIVLTAVAALKQLGFLFIDQVFLIVLGGLSLGGALAFGLGCKDLAGRWMSDVIEQVQGRKR